MDSPPTPSTLRNTDARSIDVNASRAESDRRQDDDGAANENFRRLARELMGADWKIGDLLHADLEAGTFIATHSKDSRQAVVKVILRAVTSSGLLMRLEHSLLKLLGQQHQHIAIPTQFKQDDEALCVAWPYAPGHRLSDGLRSSALSLDESLDLADALLDGLQFLHSQGILHRQVWPGSIIQSTSACDAITSTNEETKTPGRNSVKLVNVGTAFVSTHINRQCDHALDIIRYLSPESLGAIECDVSASSDLYSLGIVLFECLTGCVPFGGETSGEIIFNHMTQDLPEFGRDIPEVVHSFVRRLLEKDPAARYQTAAGAAHDLRLIRAALAEAAANANELSSEEGTTSVVSCPGVLLGRNDHRAALARPAFVGRQAELNAIAKSFPRAAAGTSTFISVEGVSGFGKTRMLTQVERLAARANCWVMRVTADAGQGTTSMLAQAIDAIVWHAERDKILRSRLASENQLNADSLLRLFPQLTLLWPDASSHLVANEQQTVASQVYAVTRLLASLGTADKPLMLLLDNCQWADDFGVDVLRRLTELHSDPMVVIAAYRGAEVPHDAALRKAEMHEHLVVGPLGDKDLAALLESMAGVLPDEVMQRIVASSEGSPFMASALLRGLVETGALSSCDGEWKLDDKQSEVLTSSDQAAGIIAQRVELLSTTARKLLCVGATLGLEFSLDDAVAITKVSRTEAMEVLGDARGRQLIWVLPDETGVAFVHDRIRSSLLAALSIENAQVIHRDIANFLVEQSSQDHAAISHHFHACGDAKSAFPHATIAAKRSQDNNAFDLAEQQYRIALNALEQMPDDRAKIHKIAYELGVVCMHRGDYPAAKAAMSQALVAADTQYERIRSTRKLGELAQMVGETLVAADHYASALAEVGVKVPRTSIGWVFSFIKEVTTQILHSLMPSRWVQRMPRKPNDEERLRLRLLGGLAMAYWYSGSAIQKLWAHLKAMNFAEQFQPSNELGTIYSDHGLAMTLCGYSARGVDYVERSFAILSDGDDIAGQGRSLFLHACVLLADARFEEAIEKGRQALPLLERAGEYLWLHFTRYQISTALVHLGRHEEGQAEALRAYRSAERIGDFQATGVLIDVLAKSGPLRELQSMFAVERERGTLDAQRRTHAFLGNGISCLEEGKAEEAVTNIEEAIRAFENAKVYSVYTVSCYVWLATAKRRLAESISPRSPERRKSLIAEARAAIWKLDFVFYMAKPYRAHRDREAAILLALRGHRIAAHRLFRRSLRRAAKSGARYQFGWTCVEYGEFLTAQGDPRGKRLVARGRRRMQRCRSVKDVSQLEEASKSNSFSLADRFDTVLASGRSITSALDQSAVYEQARAAAVRMLRGEKCAVFEVSELASGNDIEFASGDSDIEVSMNVLRQAVRTEQVVIRGDDDEGGEGVEGSTICIPIRVRDRITACIYMTHRRVRDLFGQDERRLATFITAISGAACENAEGFAQLENLNKTLEQRVAERTAAAEAANQAKSQFLATMTHELRTPMNGVLGMTELALNTDLDSTQKGYLTTVKQSAQSLLMLINDVLDLSKIEAGKMNLEHISFDIRETIQDAVGLLGPLAADKSIELVQRVSSDVPSRIMGDSTRLRQLILNIAGNAVKFTGEGHVLVEVSSWKGVSSDMLRIAIRDTGVGIPADKLNLIFDAFQQSDHSTTREFGGTGLGLSITSETVALMNGVINVESTVGVGSCFTIDIPLSEAADAADHSELVVPELVGLRVLLLTEHEEARSANTQLLEDMGLVVDSLGLDGPKIRSIFPKCDLVVLDVGVGQATTQAALEVLEAHYRSTDAGWVVLAPADGTALRLDPAINIVLKPARSRMLVEALCRATGDSQNEAPESNRSELADRNANSSGSLGGDAKVAPRKSRRILLADDGLVNQEVARGLLELKGYEVTCVDNGRLAVEAFASGDFDVILMDLEMPEMDGLEATARIRELESESDLPRVAIFAMTAHKPGSFRDKFNDGELDGYLTKPVQPELLFEAVELVQA